jgi:hypothetical protein
MNKFHVMKLNRISLLTKQEKRKFKESLAVLKILDQSIDETTRVAKMAFENYYQEQSWDNCHMMNCVYIFLIIRTSSFYDELTR